MTIWFYSDPHFDHNLMQYSDLWGPARAFSSVEEMNETLVQRHNEVVRPQDHVYCLGDFAMKKESVERWAPRLNGHKRLILGNHDIFPVSFYSQFFKKVMSYRVLDSMIFSHIPIAPWSIGSQRANIHGHCHRARPLFYTEANPEQRGFVKAVRYMNISVENTQYRPVSLEQISQWVDQS